MSKQTKGMNLPNKLTVLRICLVPIFIVIMMLPASVLNPIVSGLVGVAIFIAASVTDMRLVASSSSGAVVAANMLGKIKTVTQIVFVSTVFIEPALYAIPILKKLLPVWWVQNVPVSYVTGALTLLFTVWSGVNYFIGMWKYLDPEK